MEREVTQERKMAEAGSSWVIPRDQPSPWFLCVLKPEGDESLGSFL